MSKLGMHPTAPCPRRSLSPPQGRTARSIVTQIDFVCGATRASRNRLDAEDDDGIVVVRVAKGALVRAAQNGSKKRIDRMDMELKAFFVEPQAFISHALHGLEKRIDDRGDRLEGRLGRLEVRFEKLEVRVGAVEGRLDRVELRLDKIDDRLDKVDGRLDKIDERLEKVEGRLHTIDDRLEKIDERLGSIDGSAGIGSRLDDIDKAMRENTRLLKRLAGPLAD